MDLSGSLKEYLDNISSSSPTPGGGSVAAFSGAVACSLGIMVCNLTIGKKKYAEVENDMIEFKIKLESFKEEFLELAQKDNEAFEKVMDAFKLPKESEEQKEIRSAEIEKATLAAALVPAKVILTCRAILPLIKTISMKGNQNSVSDAGVAVSLTQTAAQGAFLNVLINYTSLTDREKAEDIFKSSESISQEIKELSDSIISLISANLRKE